jgi:hypothetical protein
MKDLLVSAGFVLGIVIGFFIRWPGRLRPVHCDPPRSVEELIGESLTKRRG